MRSQSINTNKEKDSINETEHEEPLVTNNPVIKEPRYYKPFECGKNILNSLDVTCKQACMVTSRDKYYTEMYKTLTDYNGRNNAPFSNEKIQEATNKVMGEVSISDASNLTTDTFSHTLNTQRENKT